MAEIELNTALMTNMELQDCLGRRGGTAVYRVKSTKSDQLYVLKHISVPETQRQVDALILTGAAADEAAAQAYYEQVVSDYRDELEQLEALADSPNLACFHSYEIKPKEEGIGFDVYLLAEQRTTLEDALAQTPMTQSGAVNLAMDLCSALSDLRDAGLIHRNVKPANIFLNPQGHFMLGDMGIAKIDELKYCSMPESMISPYSAPELFELMANVNETIDLYAVGLILYRIYNGNHAPFEDEKTSAKAADKQRITGQELPAPMFADYEMAGILQKACAFQPEDRYQSPAEMKQAFVDYMLRNQVGDEPITPPIIADAETQVDLEAVEEEVVEPVQFTDAEELDDTFKESFSPDNEMLNALIESVHRDIENDYTAQSAEEPEDGSEAPAPRKQNKAAKWLPTVLTVLLVLAVAAAAVWFFFIRKDTITVDRIEITDRTTDSITVSLSTVYDPEGFQVVCTDAYGNVLRQDYQEGQPNTFTGLASGAQYSFSVEGKKEENIAGSVPVNASTKATTNIISLTVSRETVSEIELTFIPDGAEPEEWSVSYGPEGQTPVTKVFTGHSVTLTGLEPDTGYVITLLDSSDFQLSGETLITGHTLPSVTITKMKTELSDSTAVVTWEFEGNAPASWTVTTTGTEGYTDTQTVLEPSVTLENLVAGERYSVIVTCDNMISGAKGEFMPDALKITALTAEANGSGGVDVAWRCEADDDDVQWLVVYTLQGGDDMSMVAQAENQTATLTGLIPGCTYSIEIQEANGEKVGGETTTEFTVPAAESFDDYGFTKGYIVMYLRPDLDDWTVNNLQYYRTTYKTSEKIAFACESVSGLEDSDDTVTILLVVRDANGNVVDHYTGEEVWNNMWTRDKYVGELLRTPEEPGEYTLEIYFNGQRVKTDKEVGFTVTE